MNRYSSSLSLLIACLLRAAFPAPATAQEEIKPENVERLIRYLSSDALGGRASFTEGNSAAASFISAEFRKAGLSPMAGSEEFEQEFSVRRLRPETTSVVFDRSVVDPANVIVSSTTASLDWSSDDSIPVVTMGEQFDRSLFRKTGKGIILIPTAHFEWFRRYQRYLGGPTIDRGDRQERVIVAVLTDLGEPGSFSVMYRAREDHPAVKNVVGVLPGKRNGECIVISAHYDHIGTLAPVDGDSIANGANDDASGTTGVIALAHHFASKGIPERTLLFAAFGGEELGGFGSRHFVELADPDTVVAMINIEMVGSPSKFGPATFWITGYERSSLGRIVSKTLEGSEYRAFPDPYPDENLFFRSDNASFARLGVPAHSFSTYRMDTDSIYHTVHDDIENIDIGVLTTTIRGIALGIKGMVEGTDTPSRITLPE